MAQLKHMVGHKNLFYEKNCTIFSNMYMNHDVFLNITGKFIEFQTVTLVPYETKLIDFTLMTPAQINWFNNYNQLIVDNVIPRLKNTEDNATIDWIRHRTMHINPWIGSKLDL